MPRPRKRDPNRVCFHLPRAWRDELLGILRADGRSQSEFIRTAVIRSIETARLVLKNPLPL